MAKKIITLEDIAVMVKHGFDEVHERLDQTATKADLLAVKTELLAVKKDMQEGFFAVNRRLDLLREDISDLPDIREEVKDLDKRLIHVERKVGSRK